MKFFLLFSILGLNLLPPVANCGEIPTPPPGPLIQRVPACVDWTTTYKYSVDDKSSHGTTSKALAQKKGGLPSARILSERVIKAGGVSYSLWVDELGAKEECWTIKGVQWVTPKGEQRRQLAINHENPFFKTGLQTSVFSGFEWISASNFTGVNKFMEKQCLVFQIMDKSGKQSIAFIDAATRLPLFLKNGGTARLYAFGPPPENLAVPEDIAQCIRDEEERTAKVMAPGAR